MSDIETWTPVSDDLPEEGQMVIAWSQAGEEMGEAYLEDGVWFWVAQVNPIDVEISHWQEMPEPPTLGVLDLLDLNAAQICQAIADEEDQRAFNQISKQ